MTEAPDRDAEEAMAAEYVLGVLDADEARAFEDLMAVDPAARTDYAYWAERLSAQTHDIPSVEPPATLWSRINAEVFPPEPQAAAGERAQGWLQRLGLLPAAAGGLIAAVFALWVINIFVDPILNPPTATAVLASAERDLMVQIAYTDNGETLQINRSSGNAPDGQVFELWLLKEDAAPISLGVLPQDETGTLQVAEALRPLLHGAECALSIEPPGGSPTGAPTGEIVAVAPIVWET